MIFTWNISKMATHIPFNIFNSKIIPIFLKNFKSKNRFLKEDSFTVVGETIKALMDKPSNELT